MTKRRTPRPDVVRTPQVDVRTIKIKNAIRSEFAQLERRAGTDTVMASWLRNAKGRIIAVINEGKCTSCMKCFEEHSVGCMNPGE